MFDNFMTPSEAIEKLRDNNYCGIYVVRIKDKNVFESINMELHNELIKRYETRTSELDKAFIVDKNTIYIGKANGKRKI